MLKDTLWSIWPLAGLWEFWRVGFVCIVYAHKDAQAHYSHCAVIFKQFSWLEFGDGNAPKNLAMRQQRRWRRKLPASKHGCKHCTILNNTKWERKCLMDFWLGFWWENTECKQDNSTGYLLSIITKTGCLLVAEHLVSTFMCQRSENFLEEGFVWNPVWSIPLSVK